MSKSVESAVGEVIGTLVAVVIRATYYVIIIVACGRYLGWW